MRPIRSLAIVLLLASVALTGCRTSQAEEPTTPAPTTSSRSRSPHDQDPSQPQPDHGPLPSAVHHYAARQPGSGL